MTNSGENKVCEGQYRECMRASLPRRGKRGGNRESALKKQLELRRNQIQEERARKESVDRGNWKKENDQKKCSKGKMMETGMEKALDIVDKKGNDQ